MAAAVPRRRPMVPVHRGGGISLAAPRPQAERAANDYLATPAAITTQPPPSLKKSPASSEESFANPSPPQLPPSASEDHGESIICRRCGKCRCLECAKARGLPSRWAWGCHWSATNAVECATCMCCVKGLLYHWGWDEDAEGPTVADRPCSCGPHLRCRRWLCLGIASIALPCLCLYPPLKGLVKLCDKTYAALTHRGCRCPATPSSTASNRTLIAATNSSNSRRTVVTPEKHLLDSSSNSSEC